LLISRAVWRSRPGGDDGNPLEASFASIAPGALAQMIENCTSFNQIADVWLDNARRALLVCALVLSNVNFSKNG